MVATAKRSLDVSVASVGVCSLFDHGTGGVGDPAASRGPTLYHQRRVGCTAGSSSAQVPVDAGERGGETGPILGIESGRLAGDHGRAGAAAAPASTSFRSLERAQGRHEPGRPAARTSRVRDRATHQIPFYGQRHIVRPGLTGGRRSAIRWRERGGCAAEASVRPVYIRTSRLPLISSS